MTEEKDIRFSEKKIDESWKAQVTKEMGKDAARVEPAKSSASQTKPDSGPKAPKSSQAFMNLVGTLGFQVMIQLGEVPSPDGVQHKPNLEAAKEIIDILVALKEKTAGNLSKEEKENLYSIVSEAQFKFAQKLG